MKVVSPCFYSNELPAQHMVRSAQYNKLEVALYGVGQQFVAHGADAQVAQLLPVLKGLSDTHVIITDCKDSLFLAGEDEFMATFEEYDAKMVMSTEKACWPPNDEVLQGMPPTKLGYDHINAGQYIGERVYIIECLEHLLNVYRPQSDLDNSQGWWPLALIRGELEFALDSECHLFQTMSSDETYDVLDKQVFFHQTGYYPCSVHFNGSSDLTKYRELSGRLYG